MGPRTYVCRLLVNRHRHLRDFRICSSWFHHWAKLDLGAWMSFSHTLHGNPLTVVLAPGNQRLLVTQDAKQRIAHEFNLSETVITHVSRPFNSYVSSSVPYWCRPPGHRLLRHGRRDCHWWSPGNAVGLVVPAASAIERVRELRTKAGAVTICTVGNGGVRAATPYAVHRHR